MKENRIVFKHSPESSRFEKPKATTVAPDFVRERDDSQAKSAESLLVQAQPETKESILFVHLLSGYESLPAEAFLSGKKPKWEAIAAKLTTEVLAKVSKLETPRIYGVNSEGQLLIGDGGNEVPSFTLKQSYFQVRNAAKSDGLSLMRNYEYQIFNTGNMEVGATWTWLESGEEPVRALYGSWRGYINVRERATKATGDNGGARRVLRVSGF